MPGIPCVLQNAFRNFHDLNLSFRPCVYFLLKRSEVVYVGKAQSLVTRVSTHLSYGVDFDRVLYLEVEASELQEQEAYWIQTCQPPLNRILKRGRPKKNA